LGSPKPVLFYFFRTFSRFSLPSLAPVAAYKDPQQPQDTPVRDGDGERFGLEILPPA
jgi:hypothetical protein